MTWRVVYVYCTCLQPRCRGDKRYEWVLATASVKCRQRVHLLAAQMCRHCNLSYLGRRLMLRWPLRSTFALFPVPQLRGMVSEKVLASISWSVSPEIFLELYPAGLGVLLSSVVLGCRFTSQTTRQSCQGCWFFSWWCFGEQPCPYRRSVAVLCMLFKMKSNLMRHLSGAVPLPYVLASVTRGTLVAHMHSFAPPRCRTSQYRRTFVPLSVSLWNDLGYSVFDCVGLAGFKSRANAFQLA